MGALWTETERRWKAIFHLRTANSRQQRKGFLHRIVIGDEKWIFYDNPKKKKYYAKPSQSLPSTSTSTSRLNIHGSKIMLCIWWDQKGLLCSAETWRFHYDIGYNWFVWAVHCEKNGRNTSKDMIKLFFFMTTLHIAKVVKKFWNAQMRCFTAPVVFFWHCSWLFRRMQQVTDSLLSQKSKIGSKIGSPPKTSYFFEMKFENCLRDGKK